MSYLNGGGFYLDELDGADYDPEAQSMRIEITAEEPEDTGGFYLDDLFESDLPEPAGEPRKQEYQFEDAPEKGEGSRLAMGFEQTKSMTSGAAEWVVENLPDWFWELEDAAPGRRDEVLNDLKAFRQEAQARADVEREALPEDIQQNLKREFLDFGPEGVLRNPGAIWDQILVQAPNYAIGVIPTVAAMAFGGAPAAVIGAVTGGLMTAGDASSQIAQEIDRLSDKDLENQSELYRQYLAEGMSPDDARDTLIEDARRWTSLGAAGLGAVFGGAFGYAGGKLMPGLGRMGRAGVAGLSESAGEGGEEGVTQWMSNIGVAEADPLREQSKGVGEAAAMGAVVAGPVATGSGAMTPYVPTAEEKSLADAQRQAAMDRLNQLQAGQDQMEAATSAEEVVAAAERMVAAPLDTFELDQFHQSLTEQGLNRQAQIDSISMPEGPFPSTKLWRETYPSGGGFLASSAETEAFEAYDGLSEEAKAVTPEPAGFRDWKAATAQVADQEVAGSIADEDTAIKTLSYLEREVGAILDNEEVGPEVRNTQIRDALERAKTQAQPTQNDNPDDTDGGDGGGGVATEKTAESPKEVTVYGSGANGKADFAGQKAAGIPAGVEANRLTQPMIEEVAKSESPVFVDSGAFGAFRKGETVDFGKVFDTYESIDAKSDTPNMRFVTPDVIGDQQATLTLQKEFADRTNKLIDRGHEALVPIQKGKLKPRQVVEQARKILGHDNFTVAVPSNEAAFTENDLRDLMRARPQRVHLLGVANNTKKLDKLTKIIRAFVPDADISSDGNQIRAVTDKKFSAEAAARKDDKAGDRIQTAPKYDETEEIQSFIANPEAVPKAQLQAFLDGLPFKMTAAEAVRDPQGLADKVEEFDPEWQAARVAYNKAVKPQAVKEVAGEVRTEMVAEKLSAKQKKAKDAGQIPLFKRAGKPLSKIRVRLQATVQETGETVEIDQRADLALEEIDNRIGALQQLLGCVA